MSGFSTPGVTVSEIASPAIAPGGGTPTVIALVGNAQGYQPFTERLILTGIAVTNLKQTGINTATVTAINNSTLATLSPGSYVVAQVNDPDGIASSGDETYSIRRIAQPSAAATIAQGSTGLITASVGVVYAISYSNAAGETGIGPDSNSIIVSAKLIGLTAIPVSADSSVTHRKIYRKISAPDGDGLYHYIATISDNTTTTYSDNLAEVTAETNPQPAPTLNSGDTIAVSYQFTNTGYFQPTTFDNFGDVVNKYGNPYNNTTGAISSDLTFAALVAFANGASEVMTVPTAGTTLSNFTNAFLTLQGEEQVDYIAAISGTIGVHTALEAHCTLMNTQGFFRKCVVGQDGSTTTIPATTLRSAAQAFNDQILSLLSPAAYVTVNPVTNQNQVLGSQYMSAAILGMLAARDPQVPLTRKTVAYFTDVQDKRTPTDKALDAAAGLLVVENKGGVMRVFQSLTTAASNVNTREMSVVRIKHELARRLRVAYDGLIGGTIPASAISNTCNAIAAAVCDGMVNEQMLSSYSNIASRQTDDPTVIEVLLSFVPIYPTNEIQVGFTINTLTGALTG